MDSFSFEEGFFGDMFTLRFSPAKTSNHGLAYYATMEIDPLFYRISDSVTRITESFEWEDKG